MGATTDVADVDRITAVATRVDLADDHDATVRAGIRPSTVAGGGDAASQAATPTEAVSALNLPPQPTATAVTTVIVAMVAVATIVVAGRCRQVAATPGSIRDRRATTGVDINIRAVVDGASTNGD